MISHPHFYTSYAVWAQTFSCPVYISVEDQVWLCRQPPRENGVLRFVTGGVGSSNEIVKGVTVVKLGGHFQGSLVLHWGNKLVIADTFFTVPVSLRLFPLVFSISEHIEVFFFCDF